jgi:hypothetical protein
MKLIFTTSNYINWKAFVGFTVGIEFLMKNSTTPIKSEQSSSSKGVRLIFVVVLLANKKQQQQI